MGHPSGAAGEATQDCESRLIAIQGPAIEQLLKENAYYRWAKIPGSIYRDNIKSIPTFGVNAISFTSAQLPEEVAYALVMTVLEQLDEFRGLHPAFARLDAAPLHRGALRYFKEAGLMSAD